MSSSKLLKAVDYTTILCIFLYNPFNKFQTKPQSKRLPTKHILTIVSS